MCYQNDTFLAKGLDSIETAFPFVLENLPVANKSELSAGIVPRQACPPSGPSFHQDHLLCEEWAPSTAPCFKFWKSFLVAGAAVLPVLLGSLIPVTCFLKKAGKIGQT